MGNSNEEKELYEAALKAVNEIIALCGTKSIEDTALNFENEEDYEKYRRKRDELVNAIADIVKFQKKAFDFQNFQTEIKDEEFWKEMEEDVKRRTRNFMRVIPYLNLDGKKRLELIDKGIDIIYHQHENLQFLIQEIGDEDLAKALYGVILESEYVIVNRYASKRQFKDSVTNNIRLEAADLEYIWDKYTENLPIVEKIAAVRNNIRRENQLSYLISKINNMEYLLSLVLDDMKMNENGSDV